MGEKRDDIGELIRGLKLAGPLNLNKEAEAGEMGHTTLSPADFATFKKVRDAYAKTGPDDKPAHDRFIHALTDPTVNSAVLQRLLYNAAHGPAELKAGLAADIMAYHPEAKNLQFNANGKTVNFSDLIKDGFLSGHGSDYDIGKWPQDQIDAVAQKTQEVARATKAKGQSR